MDAAGHPATDDPRCDVCGWPFDAQARRTGDCALCAPHDPEPHTSWQRTTTVKLAIAVPTFGIGVVLLLLLIRQLLRA